MALSAYDDEVDDVIGVAVRLDSLPMDTKLPERTPALNEIALHEFSTGDVPPLVLTLNARSSQSVKSRDGSNFVYAD